MLMSMTGFGKSTGTFKGKKVTIEIRSLNSKSLDLNMRLAPLYKGLEPLFRNVIAEQLDRGKVDLSVQIDSSGETKSVSINKELVRSYYNELQEVNAFVGAHTEDYLSLIFRMPDIFNNEQGELSDEEKSWIIDLTKQACDSLNSFRRQEGKALENEFAERLREIRTLLSEIPQYEQERTDTVKERIRKGLEELQLQPDQNRLEQEMIFYMEKMDISEEKMRLANHLDFFSQSLSALNSGKKLGFIAQEIGREINTLGSKSNHAEMQRLVVDMKDALEKIKEQVLNTL